MLSISNSCTSWFIAVHIEKHNQQNIPSVWEPTPEDLVVCDWKLRSMLSFDLKIGTARLYDIEQMWGYLADNEFASTAPFGILTNPQNKIDIKKFFLFICWNDSSDIQIKISSDNNQEGHQKMKELLKRDLTIITNIVSYSLGSAIL
ncbi:hypothetical protein XNC1_1951 [Xenorhabdus nematophila ATCC 19061]|uniref:DUF7823 domain-containing protein n=1 Tax=Xenorhabdus nematophila (strain ATCC 19061 / DSM 3370 / CCUG 14189 / LMG 1036 / NCIMB 9965 / AN6) TaxID=406817 RepID=D3VDU4_XENNA|nr:hypothetical protein [Xenorhabdus nematophila]CBJ90011.1 hypothetical protein XNC1_1951 [Xenorhabdus nematophila ATCC 19061]CEK22886.1 hypothetical protein XNC2_1892 [Xenorhabdus nematophila AN6/1]